MYNIDFRPRFEERGERMQRMRSWMLLGPGTEEDKNDWLDFLEAHPGSADWFDSETGGPK